MTTSIERKIESPEKTVKKLDEHLEELTEEICKRQD